MSKPTGKASKKATRKAAGKAKTRRRDYYHDPQAPRPTSRKPSASVVARDGTGRILMLQRTDNNLWTIPTGVLKINETITECGIRECREETGIHVEVTGLVGVFSDPAHLVAYSRGDKILEVRQPVNICLHARPTSGTLTPDPDEAQHVAWIRPEDLPNLAIHPAIRARIQHALDHPDTPLVQ
jgi:ADP-ribose pyrophosphatase YjhB (NUDIX family)